MNRTGNRVIQMSYRLGEEEYIIKAVCCWNDGAAVCLIMIDRKIMRITIPS